MFDLGVINKLDMYIAGFKAYLLNISNNVDRFNILGYIRFINFKRLLFVFCVGPSRYLQYAPQLFIDLLVLSRCWAFLIRLSVEM